MVQQLEAIVRTAANNPLLRAGRLIFEPGYWHRQAPENVVAGIWTSCQLFTYLYGGISLLQNYIG